jgi:hypothetical protein
MGGAPLVILLVGMVVPIAVLILAIVFDAFVGLWLLYRLWHDEWSMRLWNSIRRVVHVPHWHVHPARHR